MKDDQFAHLHLHTDYSLLDGCATPETYADEAVRMGQTALAITDHGDMGGCFRFWDACKTRGLKPIIGCCPTGTPVVTTVGPKAIEDVRVGDLVLTHKGRFRRVVHTMSKRHDGSMYRLKLWHAADVCLTEEHPLLAYIPDYKAGLCGNQSIPSKYHHTWLKPGDIPAGRVVRSTQSSGSKRRWLSFACIPRFQDSIPPPSVDVRSHLDASLASVMGEHKGSLVRVSKRNPNDTTHIKSFPSQLDIDEDMMTLIGFYLSEGSLGHSSSGACSVTWTFNIDETDFVDTVVRILDKLHLLPRVYRRKNKSIAEVVAGSSILARLLDSMFGHGAKHKRVPYIWLGLPDNLLQSLVSAILLGDAKLTEKQISLKMANHNLVRFVMLANMRLHGSSGRVSYGYGDKYNWSYTASTGASPTISAPSQYGDHDQNFVYVPIRSIDEVHYDGSVYNLHVADDNSYVTDVALHNCEVYVNANRDLHPINKALRRQIVKAASQAKKHEKDIYAEELARLIEEEGDGVLDCEAQARGLAKAGRRRFLQEAGIDPADMRRLRHMKMEKSKQQEVDEGTGVAEHKTKDKHLILLAKNEVGFQNLSTIVSEAHRNGFYRKPRTTPELIRQHSEGLICLSACLGSETSRAIASGDMDEARRIMQFYKETFGEDYYAEIQSNEIDEQKDVNYRLLELAGDLGVKKVATVDCHYCFRGDAKMQDALMAKQRHTRVNDPNVWKFDARRLWLKSVDEVVNEYGELGFKIGSSDVRQACATTLEIADKCDGDYMEWGQFQFPHFDTGSETPDGMLQRLCEEGFKWRLSNGFIDPDQKQEYAKRIEKEYDVICKKEFATYFLVVWDMVRWAKESRIFVGGGRGSVAGSLVAYVLRITEVDPLRFGLIFERFLNAGRSGKMLRIEKRRLTPLSREEPEPEKPTKTTADHRNEAAVKNRNDVYG